MQHRYAGDIGDYLKLSMLKALTPSHRLGVAWWLYPDESHNSDGRHTRYLLDAPKWRHYDPAVFDHLQFALKGDRRIEYLERAAFLAGCRFCSVPIPQSIDDRDFWVCRQLDQFRSCDLVFIDPDNGFSPRSVRPGSPRYGKSISLDEIQSFCAKDRTVIVYHHQTRFKGGHIEEIRYWASRLEMDYVKVDVIQCRPYQHRLYVVLNASQETRRTLERLCNSWGEKMLWNPHLKQA